MGSCDNCSHRLTRQVCGEPKSPHFKTTVALNASCSEFAASPAQTKFLEGMRLAYLEKDREAAEAIQAAIEFGLPGEDEAHAMAYRAWCLARAAEDPESDAALEALKAFESSLRTDRKEGYGVFLDKSNRDLFFSKFDRLCFVRAELMSRSGSLDAAITMLEEIAALVTYLPGTHLPLAHYQLGCLYDTADRDSDKALEAFRRATTAESDDSDESFIDEVRGSARRNAEILARQLQSADGTATSDIAAEMRRIFDLGDAGDHAGAIAETRRLLKGSLDGDDEVKIRALLGVNLRFLNNEPESAETTEGLAELEQAARLDRTGGYDVLAVAAIQRLTLGRADLAYYERSENIRRQQGIDAAITYLEDKSKIFSYIPKFHLPKTNFHLGCLYFEKEQLADARRCWELSLQGETAGIDYQPQIRQAAQDNMKLLEEKERGPKPKGFFGRLFGG